MVINRWYLDYYAQTWYANTFLVRRPEQIARAIAGERDWNNIYDAGCNFVCLAMIVGIDPARMASLLASQRYFFADSSLPALTLTGKRSGLVWDLNGPSEVDHQVTLTNLWHPHLQRRETITIKLVSIATTRNHETGKAIISRARQRGLHVICGPEEHSHLVAGRIGADFYVWDPDDTVVSVEDNLRGSVRLKTLFDGHSNESIEFWLYQVEVTP